MMESVFHYDITTLSDSSHWGISISWGVIKLIFFTLEHLVSDMKIIGLFHVVLIAYQDITISKGIVSYRSIATLLIFDFET